MVRPAFYVGGFNASTKERGGIVKSKMFTGIISNLEIINTRSNYIPGELLDFVRMKQTIRNSIWMQIADTVES